MNSIRECVYQSLLCIFILQGCLAIAEEEVEDKREESGENLLVHADHQQEGSGTRQERWHSLLRSRGLQIRSFDQYNNFYNRRQYYNPRPYQVPYDDSMDALELVRPPNINQQQFNFGYPYPPPPYPYLLPQPTTTTTTTTTAKPPSTPMGYMLINTYDTPRGSYSRPIAFFKTRR